MSRFDAGSCAEKATSKTVGGHDGYGADDIFSCSRRPRSQSRPRQHHQGDRQG
jgi:hypothetical protein